MFIISSDNILNFAINAISTDNNNRGTLLTHHNGNIKVKGVVFSLPNWTTINHKYCCFHDRHQRSVHTMINSGLTRKHSWGVGLRYVVDRVIRSDGLYFYGTYYTNTRDVWRFEGTIELL